MLHCLIELMLFRYRVESSHPKISRYLLLRPSLILYPAFSSVLKQANCSLILNVAVSPKNKAYNVSDQAFSVVTNCLYNSSATNKSQLFWSKENPDCNPMSGGKWHRLLYLPSKSVFCIYIHNLKYCLVT